MIPNQISENNGYRYYCDEQLNELNRIKEYRRYGLSLKEIKQIISGNIDEKIALAERNIQLEHEIQTSISIKMQLDKYMSCHKTECTRQYEIIENKTFEQKEVITRKENIELEHLGMSIGKLHEIAAQNGLIIAGSHYVRYDFLFDESGDFTMETCLPVITAELLPQLCVEEPSATCIYTMHTSGFSSIGNAHQKIIEYAQKRKIKLTGKAFEVYNSDMSAEVYYEIYK